MTQPLRVLVCGGREYADRETLERVLSAILTEFYWGGDSPHPGVEIIEGGGTGADELARRWAIDHECPVSTYPADWARFGDKAGPIRNGEMLRRTDPDVVIAFPGGAGTRDMLAKATGRR